MKTFPSFFRNMPSGEYANFKGKIMLEREQNLVELDGNVLKSKFDVFNAFSLALRFPRYFGEDWSAFCECLCELSWFENKNTAILIKDPVNIDEPCYGRCPTPSKKSARSSASRMSS